MYKNKREGQVVNYPILGLGAQSAHEAATKLHFALATEHFRGEEFLRVDFLCDSVTCSKLRGAALRVLRERKRQGKIRFFLLAEDFASEKPEAQFIANKYPQLLLDASLIEGENSYILVKL